MKKIGRMEGWSTGRRGSRCSCVALVGEEEGLGLERDGGLLGNGSLPGGVLLEDGGLDLLLVGGVDPLLHLVAEMPDDALHGPGGSITKSADGVALDLMPRVSNESDMRMGGAGLAYLSGKLVEHVNLIDLGVALDHALHHVPQPRRTLTAGSALTARFVPGKGRMEIE